MSVLIVVSNPLVALDLKEIISGMDINHIFVVANELEARRVVSTQNIVVILLEISLNNGLKEIAFATQLKKEHSINIIFLMEHTNREMNDKAGNANPISIIDKPFREEDVVDAMKLAIIDKEQCKVNSCKN